MLFNMILPGAVSEEPFAFEYSGNYTDNRDADGKGTVRFNTSGTLTVTGQAVTVSAYILGAGGGASAAQQGWADYMYASGGGGGYQTVEVELKKGTYAIEIGTGGISKVFWNAGGYGGTGGSTSAFGYTSAGGNGGYTLSQDGTTSATAGTGGSPNGNNGGTGAGAAGGSPNGANAPSELHSGIVVPAGGDGYVELTFI